VSFYRKYRPTKFSDLIGQDHIRDTLVYAFKNNQITHAYLFTGPRGTGKTSTARLIAKTLNCEKFKKNPGEPCNSCDSCKEIMEGRSIDIIEIDAASNRGIEEIRELRENVKFAPTKSKYKVFIIDEVHMLTREAFNALLKTLEEPPGHVIFILATTEAHKVPATVISRTQRFDFARIKKDDLIKYLKKVSKAEKINIEDEALDLIAVMAEGGHRDAVSLLEQVSVSGKKITVSLVRDILGITEKKEVFDFLGAIFNTNSEEGLKIAQNLFASGKSMAQFNKEVIEIIRKIMLYKATEKLIFDDIKENIEKIIALSKLIDLKQSRDILDIFIEFGVLLKDVSYPLMPIEMATIESVSLFGTNNSIESSKKQETNDKQAPNIKSNNSKQEVIAKSEEMKYSEGDPYEQSDKKIATPDGLPPEVGQSAMAEEKPKQPMAKSPNGTEGAMIKEKKNVTIQKERRIDADNGKNGPKSIQINKPTNDQRLATSESVALSSSQWSNVVMLTKKENNSLAALLRDARPIAFKQDLITLGVKFQFHKDKISEMQNIKLIEKFAEEVLGKKCKVNCQISDFKKRNIKPASDNELIEAAEEIFG